jgi:hypothetical protein
LKVEGQRVRLLLVSGPFTFYCKKARTARSSFIRSVILIVNRYSPLLNEGELIAMLSRLRQRVAQAADGQQQQQQQHQSADDDQLSKNIAPSAGDHHDDISENNNSSTSSNIDAGDETKASTDDAKTGSSDNNSDANDDPPANNNKPKLLFSRWIQATTSSDSKPAEANTETPNNEVTDDSAITKGNQEKEGDDDKGASSPISEHENEKDQTNHNSMQNKLWSRWRQISTPTGDAPKSEEVSSSGKEEEDTLIPADAENKEKSIEADGSTKNEDSPDDQAAGNGQSQSMSLMFLRFRQTASKVYEESTAKIVDMSISEAHADQDNSSSSSDQKDDGASEAAAAAAAAAALAEKEETEKRIQEALRNDPKISGLSSQILHAQHELKSMKATRKGAEKRRQQEIGKLRQDCSGKGRALWFATQKMRRFNGLNEYNDELMRCSLPSHDSSPATIKVEAKLLRSQHQSAVLDHQMTIVHEFQQSMIDYLYTKALPDIKAEHVLAAEVGQSQVDKMIKSEQHMVQLFEDCLGLQRKILAKYKLRELEHSREIDHELQEHLKVMAGEIPAMERDPELRDSAKKRLEERHKLLEERGERRRSRDEELLIAAHEVENEEKSALEKAQEQIASLSNHSMDLLLQDIDDDDDDDDDDDQEAKSGSQEGVEPKKEHDDENDGKHEISESQVAETDNVISPSERSFAEFSERSEVEGEDKEQQLPQTSTKGRKLEAAVTIPEDSTSDVERYDMKPSEEMEKQDQVAQQESQEAPPPPESPRTSTARLARVRARQAARENGNEESERSQSEGGEDNPEPASPLSTISRRRLSSSRHRPSGAGSRTDLLERARSARLHTGPVNSVSASSGQDANTARVRPSLGAKAMSSRDFASRRASSHRAGRGGLGLSEHRASTRASLAQSEHRASASSDHQTRVRHSITAGSSADRQARMERLASRRRLTDTSAHKSPRTTEGKRPVMSAERRAQLRSGLSSRNVTNNKDSAVTPGNSENGD